MELGITGGDWKVEKHSAGAYYGNLTAHLGNQQISTIAVFTKYPAKDIQEANARLIADAGTTANKCGLLPSEILEQLVECKKALQFVASCDESIDNMELGHVVQQALNNTLNK